MNNQDHLQYQYLKKLDRPLTTERSNKHLPIAQALPRADDININNSYYGQGYNKRQRENFSDLPINDYNKSYYNGKSQVYSEERKKSRFDRPDSTLDSNLYRNSVPKYPDIKPSNIYQDVNSIYSPTSRVKSNFERISSSSQYKVPNNWQLSNSKQTDGFDRNYYQKELNDVDNLRIDYNVHNSYFHRPPPPVPPIRSPHSISNQRNSRIDDFIYSNTSSSLQSQKIISSRDYYSLNDNITNRNNYDISANKYLPKYKDMNIPITNTFTQRKNYYMKSNYNSPTKYTSTKPINYNNSNGSTIGNISQTVSPTIKSNDVKLEEDNDVIMNDVDDDDREQDTKEIVKKEITDIKSKSKIKYYEQIVDYQLSYCFYNLGFGYNKKQLEEDDLKEKPVIIETNNNTVNNTVINNDISNVVSSNIVKSYSVDTQRVNVNQSSRFDYSITKNELQRSNSINSDKIYYRKDNYINKNNKKFNKYNNINNKSVDTNYYMPSTTNHK